MIELIIIFNEDMDKHIEKSKENQFGLRKGIQIQLDLFWLIKVFNHFWMMKDEYYLRFMTI